MINLNLADILKALSDENRLKIVKMLNCGDMCVCDICENLDLSQPAVSHHLKLLSDAELLNTKRQGKWIYYSVNRPKFEELQDQVKNLTVKPENCDLKILGCENCEE